MGSEMCIRDRFKKSGDNGKKPGERSKFRLPEGQTCSRGTCNMAHDQFSPGAPCYRDHLYMGPPPQAIRNNAKQLARIEEDRRSNALKRNLPYTPMHLSTPKAAAAVPIDGDADFCAHDIFQLPATMCPIVPSSTTVIGSFCPPCDPSQWDYSDDDSPDAAWADSASPTTSAMSAVDDAHLPTYECCTPIRYGGDGMNGTDLVDESQLSYSDDDADAPPPPPTKPLPSSRRVPSPFAAESRTAWVKRGFNFDGQLSQVDDFDYGYGHYDNEAAHSGHLEDLSLIHI